MDEEGLTNTENDLIHIGKPIQMDDEWFKRKLRQLDEASYREEEHIILRTVSRLTQCESRE